MKPKILVFTTAYFPFFGGAEVAIREIAKRTQDRFDFYIAASRFSRRLPRSEKFPEGMVKRIGWGTRLDKWFLPLAAPFLLDSESFAAVWGMDISQGSLAAIIYKFFHPRVPFIFTIQYGYGEKRLERGRGGTIAWTFRRMLGAADYVTAISTYLLNLAKNYGYKGPATVLPNGVDIQKFKIQNSKFKITGQNSKVIITASRLVPKNAVDVLIRAVAEIKKEIPEIRCKVLGDGPQRQKLEKLAKDLDVKKDIDFLGSVPHENIPSYLREADVFVRASRSEGMGNSFVEALSAGLPVIGTPVEGILDIIEDCKTGLFVKVDDPKDLAGKIKLLLKDRALAKIIVKNGRKMVEEKFNWNKIAENFAGIFAEFSRPPKLEIIIATPLYPPVLGGPAFYARTLEKEFKNAGHKVKVVSFGNFLKYPPVLRHFLYFSKLFSASLGADIILALDNFSAGLPAVWVHLVLRKPLVTRWEGDFLWENFVERRRADLTLRDFYEKPPRLSFKEKFVLGAQKCIVRNSNRLVFSSLWRKELTGKFFKVAPGKEAFIKNIWPAAVYQLPVAGNPKIILWAGRMLYLKNLERLIGAFAGIGAFGWELHLIGDGPEKINLEKFVSQNKIKNVFFESPVPREILDEKISSAAFLVLPSFSEVGPNIIAEAVERGTPFLLTQESGYAEFLKNCGVLANPFDENDLKKKLQMLMNEEIRSQYRGKIKMFRDFNPAESASGDWLRLFYEIVGSGRRP